MFGSILSAGAALGGYGLGFGENYLKSAQSFAWNGKDLRRQVRYQRKMIDYQNEASKGMSLWSAQNMPRATMQGLKSAGLNPLLAAGGSTNVSPMVASSAASVPYSESYVPSQGGGDTSQLASLFSGRSGDDVKANRARAAADRAEQEARRKFFESAEGRKAVRDKLIMQYGPQSPFELATKGASSAKDAASSLAAANAATDDYGRTGLQTFADTLGYYDRMFDRWFYGAGKSVTHTGDDGRIYFGKPRTYRKKTTTRTHTSTNNSRNDNSRHYNFYFGRGPSADSHVPQGPIWDFKR